MPSGIARARRAPRRPPDRTRRRQHRRACWSRGTGRSVVALEIVVPIEAVERHRIDDAARLGVLPLSAVSLIVPRTGVDLTVSGGFVAEQTETNAENRWMVYGLPGRPLRFSWKRKIEQYQPNQ